VKRGVTVHAVSAADMGETKLVVQRDGLSVKIEVNTVIRGTVHPPRTRSLAAAASDALMADLELPLLSLEDVYGGKLVAAMDRQHPRDLFDVMELFAHGVIHPRGRQIRSNHRSAPIAWMRSFTKITRKMPTTMPSWKSVPRKPRRRSGAISAMSVGQTIDETPMAMPPMNRAARNP